MALLAIKEMPWPLKKEDALERVLGIGVRCEDLLIQLSTQRLDESCSHPLMMKYDRGSGAGSSSFIEDGLGLGYWAWHALTRLQVSRGAAEMSSMRSAVPIAVGANASRLIERGSILLVISKLFKLDHKYSASCYCHVCYQWSLEA